MDKERGYQEGGMGEGGRRRKRREGKGTEEWKGREGKGRKRIERE